MHVFIGEYISGGGFIRSPLDAIPSSLRREGHAMICAVAEDFSPLVDAVHVPLDERFGWALPPNVVIHPIHSRNPLWPQWIEAARGCERSLVIAPETDGLLARGVAVLQATGIESLNGFGDFLRCASDKWETARTFAAAGVPHPPTWTAERIPAEPLPADFHSADSPSAGPRWVVKPRDGCGMGDLSVYPTQESACEAAAGSDRLIQRWVEGRAASIAVIVEGQDWTMLPAVAQCIAVPEAFGDAGDQPVYRGGCGPLSDDEQSRAARLARMALEALPRTIRGYVGLDIVLAENSSRDCVIEVNPRITTSYVGLRQIVKGNLAARILGLDHSPVTWQAQYEQISWNAAGEVCFN